MLLEAIIRVGEEEEGLRDPAVSVEVGLSIWLRTVRAEGSPGVPGGS